MEPSEFLLSLELEDDKLFYANKIAMIKNKHQIKKQDQNNSY